MKEALAAEMLEAYQGLGSAIRKRDARLRSLGTPAAWGGGLHECTAAHAQICGKLAPIDPLPPRR